MRVRLIIFASGGMGATSGDSGIALELPDGSSLQDVLDIFLKKYGKEFIGGSEDYQRHYLSRYITLSVNSHVVFSEKAREFVLHDNDAVAIVPIITGG